jgi:hypothetical protein
MRSALLRFGAPPDAVAWAALVLAIAAAAFALGPSARARDWLERHPNRVVALLALLAALLSAGYVQAYLRGGPRIIDATSYYLEARALAAGMLDFEIPAPSGSFRGRFLLAAPGAASLSVIFPPGYPALLAIGFIAGAPLAVGPVIAAALVVATYALALRLFGSVRIALLAALLGLLSAALRYHTADTMSHGWGALLAVIALLGALSGGRWLFLAGFALGWLVATRPVTGAAVCVLALVAARGCGARGLFALALAAIPGVALLALHQRAATGSWLTSTQLAYYAVADAPAGCFGYGFGPSVGCMHEHGDFVRERLGDGFGLLAALGTTLRRLHHHLLDVANLELLALLVPLAAITGRRERGIRLLALGPALLIAAHVPFYFDGTYPGGGARMYAEALPFEQISIAWLLTRWQLGRFAPPLSLAGFALHASFSHLALRDREGGRPMFEQGVLERAGVRSGLVLVSTDHGFNLGHQPGARDLVVARRRSGAHDFILWERLGRPAAYVYDYDPWSADAIASITPHSPARTLRFEAEAEWPPLAVRGGSALPGFPAAQCTSERAALRLVPTEDSVSATLELVPPLPGRYQLVSRWVDSAGAAVSVSISGSTSSATAGDGCWELRGPSVLLEAKPTATEVSARGQAAWLDALELGWLGPPPGH